MKRILTLLLAFTISFSAVSSPDDDSNISNRINSLFTPLVEFMGGIIFWDPFEAMGIYDPVAYNEGVPLEAKRLEGRVSGEAGKDVLIGDDTEFRNLKYNDKVIIAGEVYKVKDVVAQFIYLII